MRILFLFSLLSHFCFSQSFEKNILRANSLFFRSSIFCYGYQEQSNELHLKVYKTSLDLKQVDSISIKMDKGNINSFLEIGVDTLHGYLNFYTQKANKKNETTLIRLNDSLRLITKKENVSTQSINSLTNFESETISTKHSIYIVRNTIDSLGKQYFLNKYKVINEKEVFEYKQEWQLPLEKRNINLVHIIHADTNSIFLYVNIIGGEKSGQWALKIDSKKGTLIRGIKLNDKNDTRSYLYNTFLYDKKNKKLLICGNIYHENQMNFEKSEFTFTNLNKQNTFYFIFIDSLFENKSKFEKTVPYTFANQKSANKEITQYIVKTKNIQSVSKTDYQMYCNLFKKSSNSLDFTYESGYFINFSFDELTINFYPDKIHLNLIPQLNLISKDSIDLNGKYRISNSNELDKLLYRWPTIGVESVYGLDLNKHPKWILSKTDFKLNTKKYFYVFLGKKGIEAQLILEGNTSCNPTMFKVDNEKLIMFSSNPERTNFRIAIKNW